MSERMTNWPTNWPREIAELKAERDVLRATVERVRQIHHPFPIYPHVDVCAVDSHPYPCQTIRALNGDSDE